MCVIDRFEALYSQFDKHAIELVPQVYADNIVFVDPITEHKGLTQVTHYFENLVSNTKHCECQILKRWDADEHTVLTWKMLFSHPSIKSGAVVEVDGVTHLTISNDRVIYHRDFYDMGQMIYEHLPLIGSLVRAIKRRMSR